MTDAATETSVLMMAANGLSPARIALALGIPRSQVEAALRRVPPDKPTPPRAA